MTLTPEAYITAASILSGFGITVLMFRLQRELSLKEGGEDAPPRGTRLAWADYLVLAATFLSLVFVVLPLVPFREAPGFCMTLAAVSCSAASVLLVGYPFAIIDHYRIEWGKYGREGDGAKGEPGERLIVTIVSLLAVVLFGGIVICRTFASS